MGRFRHCKMMAWRLQGIPETILENGVGRFVLPLQRLNLFFCKISDSSAGVRQFIKNDLIDFAQSNPSVVVYLEPKRFKAPFIVGEYLNGRLASVRASNFSRLEVKQWVNYLRSRSGFPIVHFNENQRTLCPSIQGYWNPFENAPSCNNVKTFPLEDGGPLKNFPPSASDILIEMAKQQRRDLT
ncbi:39S ribosomal protein L43, mitochondrial [Trichinella pseudospiralis]|uniref:Large ribosomal subunit protein mL43 n=2 Tax=Trichinella pseudospiralis TaxID=6337 RepID=A0A0V1IHA0_TRIPS|nr:39S ribosomal protein L43, mitochondrial [Trichinella pseudospiralis]KRY78265.1 39S ribosomal protein L43, mitochondrial [Trichinella pseudospiralis]KRY82723.1 39S ribosomal protein L43, mitochondrial [Trichinella pseudospiralis]KRZ22140.1 39S ribosomal protein L43, mitochondrial [Trichinella pseudospiralis]KRZ44932.1 39S ribosomal protein L43, mitochondrial [Trichinella pseudospiralis]